MPLTHDHGRSLFLLLLEPDPLSPLDQCDCSIGDCVLRLRLYCLSFCDIVFMEVGQCNSLCLSRKDCGQIQVLFWPRDRSGDLLMSVDFRFDLIFGLSRVGFNLIQLMFWQTILQVAGMIRSLACTVDLSLQCILQPLSMTQVSWIV